MNWNWKEFSCYPEPGNQLWIRYEDGTEKRAFVRENWSGTTLMIQGDCGQYWRSMVGPKPTHWRYDEIPDGCLGAED